MPGVAGETGRALPGGIAPNPEGAGVTVPGNAMTPPPTALPGAEAAAGMAGSGRPAGSFWEAREDSCPRPASTGGRAAPVVAPHDEIKDDTQDNRKCADETDLHVRTHGVHSFKHACG